MHDYNWRLYANPSFIEGMARILDFYGTLAEYNQSLTPEQADLIALKSDWVAIGWDLRTSLNQYLASHEAAEDRQPSLFEEPVGSH